MWGGGVVRWRVHAAGAEEESVVLLSLHAVRRNQGKVPGFAGMTGGRDTYRRFHPTRHPAFGHVTVIFSIETTRFPFASTVAFMW
jgi:hypothetical protein